MKRLDLGAGHAPLWGLLGGAALAIVACGNSGGSGSGGAASSSHASSGSGGGPASSGSGGATSASGSGGSSSSGSGGMGGASSSSSSAASSTTASASASSSSSASASSSSSASASSSSSASASSSSSASASSSGSSGACTEITFAAFIAGPNDGTSGDYASNPIPDMGDPTLIDMVSLEFYGSAYDPSDDGEDTGTFDLSAMGGDNYLTCSRCLLLYVDPSSGKSFFQKSGTLVVDAASDQLHGKVTGTLTDVTLVEVTIDPSTSATTPVPGGACLHVASASIDAG